ncbi:MAG TPA: hypothetical protein DEH02_01605 [Bacteroidales bacterium]|nr:hypothetical protein [Bacteroidales bacterium]
MLKNFESCQQDHYSSENFRLCFTNLTYLFNIFKELFLFFWDCKDTTVFFISKYFFKYFFILMKIFFISLYICYSNTSKNFFNKFPLLFFKRECKCRGIFLLNKLFSGNFQEILIFF